MSAFAGQARSVDSDKRSEVLEALLGRLLGAVAAADGKIGAVFATDTAMLGVLAALIPKYGSWSPTEATVAAMGRSLLLGSILMLSFASFPRTSGPRRSLLFFGSICKLPLATYLEELGAFTIPEYIKDLGTQCHRNAEIAARKHFWIKWAIKAMYVAVPFWLLAILLLYRRRP